MGPLNDADLVGTFNLDNLVVATTDLVFWDVFETGYTLAWDVSYSSQARSGTPATPEAGWVLTMGTSFS